MSIIELNIVNVMLLNSENKIPNSKNKTNNGGASCR